MPQLFDGVFFKNSSTNPQGIKDGSSNTIMVGERSKGWVPSQVGVAGEFDSTWVGVVTDSEYAGWRVLGWTGEPPNNDPGQNSEVHYHGFAQFNSPHLAGLTIFGFADGSVHPISEDIAPAVFRAFGTTRGSEIISSADLR